MPGMNPSQSALILPEAHPLGAATGAKEQRNTEAKLKVHMNRMKELISKGMDKTQASKQAYEELKSGKLKKEIADEDKRLRQLRGRK